MTSSYDRAPFLAAVLGLAAALLPPLGYAQAAAAPDADASHGAIIDRTPERRVPGRTDVPAPRSTDPEPDRSRQTLPDGDRRHDTRPDHDASGRLAVPQPDRDGIPDASTAPAAPAANGAPGAPPDRPAPGRTPVPAPVR